MNNVFGFAANMKIRIGLALGLAFALAFAMAPVQAFAAIERSIYIVQIQPGTDIEVRKAIASMGETPLDELDYVLDGFTLSLTALEAEQLALNPAVISVAPDEAMSLFDIDTPPTSWGLDRLHPSTPTLNQSLTSPHSVKVYRPPIVTVTALTFQALQPAPNLVLQNRLSSFRFACLVAADRAVTRA